MNYTLQKEIYAGNIKVFEALKDYFECLVCDCKISGQDQAVSHVQGVKHLKKIMLQENADRKTSNFDETPKCVPQQPNDRPVPAPRHMIPGRLDIKPNESRECHLCKVQLNGITPWNDHIKGKGHLRKVQLAKNSASEVSCSSVEALSQLNSSCSDLNLTLQYGMSPARNVTESNVSEIHCKTCDVFVSGEVPYKQHCEGKQHLKKLSLLTISGVCDEMSDSSSVYDDNIRSVPSHDNSSCRLSDLETRSDSPSNPQADSGRNTFITIGSNGIEIHCKACDVYVNGEVPYKQHCKGKQHLKKLRLLKINEDSDDVSDSSSVYDENSQSVPCPETASFCLHDLGTRSDSPSYPQADSGRNSFITISADREVPLLFK